MSKIILVALILVVFVVGGGVGILYQTGAVKGQVDAIKILSSKTVPSIVAFGTVNAINGNKLTIESAGQTSVIQLKDNAVISAIAKPQTDKPSAADNAKLSDIKLGSIVNIGLQVQPNGSILGQTVVIFPK